MENGARFERQNKIKQVQQVSFYPGTNNLENLHNVTQE